MKKILSTLLFAVVLSACDSQLIDSLGTVYETGGITNQQAAMGLKDALSQGAVNGSETVSKLNGYYGNPQIRIPWPEEAELVRDALKGIGMTKLVGDVERSINRAAEEAATQAAPIFIDAIKAMTIQDALDILFGAEDAATRYLERTTTPALTAAFAPVIDRALDKTEATRYWEDAIGTYNKIPLVADVDPDLVGFVTAKALDGLFVMVQKEEKRIRENPGARSTDIMREVFGYYDANK